MNYSGLGAAGRLPARSRNLLLTAHIVSTVSALGAEFVILALGLAGLSGSDPRSVYPAMGLVGSSVMAPLAVLSLVSGVVLARLTVWGVFRYWWVTIKLIVSALLTTLVLLVLVPRLAGAARAVGAGAALTEAERLQLVLTSATGTTLLIGLIVLAVFKPSWRLPRRATGRSVAGPL
jgi:hypothetical protein